MDKVSSKIKNTDAECKADADITTPLERKDSFGTHNDNENYNANKSENRSPSVDLIRDQDGAMLSFYLLLTSFLYSNLTTAPAPTVVIMENKGTTIIIASI